MNYDVIGDIHGHADALHRLLARLDYRERDGAYRHASRKAIFLGDFIDRGPEQVEVLSVVRAMAAAGTARAVMGNHEFNALGWATPDGSGGFLRPHTEKNERQHAAFLVQIGSGSPAHREALAWFASLPVWLDLGGLRIVHACWHAASQACLAATCLDASGCFHDGGLRKAYRSGTPEHLAADVLLKGPEVQLPGGHSFRDKDGHTRHEARLRWWDRAATTFRLAVLGLDERRSELPDEPVPSDYHYDEPVPVMFGHYWMSGRPQLLSPTTSCLDFSVAKGGVLTAYRWSGEAVLSNDNLAWVTA
ncbi:metallophosphoesterase [Labrys sp. KNU-23]|uniref:metallophosphoesterase n=1 Tax=Labrys sp. KNU-23 TaxID=2789216 RepID=UPI0011F05F81|nr:metallophosphoesterase [Labrys sp. KNU-23]QEN91115.1 metallophosphoesterase [Labrys sp. KNU-23]